MGDDKGDSGSKPDDGTSLTIQFVPPRNLGGGPRPPLAEFSDSRTVTREDLLRLFEVLINLRNRSDPAGGSITAVYKQDRAREAIEYANALALGLAGWAYNHMVGLELSPMQSPDSHVHEENGKRIQASDFIDEPRRCGRPVLACLIENVREFLPDGLGTRLAHGLRALDYGEVFSFLKPTKKGLRNRGYTDWSLRFIAVCHWHHLQALGEKSEDAQAKVAGAFGEGKDAVKQWNYRLSEHFEAPQIEMNLRKAKHAAVLKLQGKTDPLKHKLTEADWSALELFEEGCLEAYGQLYKTRGEGN